MEKSTAATKRASAAFAALANAHNELDAARRALAAELGRGAKRGDLKVIPVCGRWSGTDLCVLDIREDIWEVVADQETGFLTWYDRAADEVEAPEVYEIVEAEFQPAFWKAYAR